MSDTELAQAFRDYFEGYGDGDQDRVVGAFAEGGYAAFPSGTPITGDANLRKAHERIGTFHFKVERVHGYGPDIQGAEGKLLALRKGEELVDMPIPFGAFGELTDGGKKFKAFRIYYDVTKVYAAIKVADAPDE